MAYTFGGATSDDVAQNSFNSMFVDNGQQLITGWFYPTTLTADRTYWSFGDVANALKVGATTSELSVVTDNVTTDGVWDTTGAGITVNKWWFIAVLVATENTTVAGAVRVWVGDEYTAPVEISVANTVARNGNYAPSSAFTVGNLGTGSVAFQGDIDNINIWFTNVPFINNIFSIAASGVITNTEAEFIFQRLILPTWLGNPNLLYRVSGIAGGTINMISLTLDYPGSPQCYHFNNNNAAPMVVTIPTVSGATFTGNRSARYLRRDWTMVLDHMNYAR